MIRNVDLILTTSSTSSLEFIACGPPVGVACAVENQKQYYAALGQLGIATQLDFILHKVGGTLMLGRLLN